MFLQARARPRREETVGALDPDRDRRRLLAEPPNLHSALQKHLKARLSTTGASFARFADAAPLATG
jgi:hypothetical protein